MTSGDKLWKKPFLPINKVISLQLWTKPRRTRRSWKNTSQWLMSQTPPPSSHPPMALVVQLQTCSPTTILRQLLLSKNLHWCSGPSYRPPSDDTARYFHVPATWRIGEGVQSQGRNHQTHVTPHLWHYWLQDALSHRYYVSNTITRNGSSVKSAPCSLICSLGRFVSAYFRTYQRLQPF